MLDHVPYLAVPLPEDIRRRKDAGYFSEALKLIELRLGADSGLGSGLPVLLR